MGGLFKLLITKYEAIFIFFIYRESESAPLKVYSPLYKLLRAIKTYYVIFIFLKVTASLSLLLRFY